MKSKHTPGPWLVAEPYDEHSLCIHATLPESKLTGMPAIACGRNLDHAAANAGRLVACLNGCDQAGVAEPGALRDVLEVLNQVLLEADDTDSIPDDIVAGAKAALRKVRGEP